MGEVQVDDLLFDELGKICRVIKISTIQQRDCYQLIFDDGSQIVCDDVHRWAILPPSVLEAQMRKDPDRMARRRYNRESRSTGKRPDLALRNSEIAAKHRHNLVEPWDGAVVVETSQIDVSGRKPAIPVINPLEMPCTILPIHPYVFGAWLGDGASASGGITCDERYPFVIEQITACGHSVNKWSQINAYGIADLTCRLRRLGVLRNKHIPMIYLRAGISQRQELLAGIIDTDGTVNKDGTCELVSVCEGLAHDYYELIVSLGFKATFKKKKTTCQTGAVGEAYRIMWSGKNTPIRDPRKKARLPVKNRSTICRRYIVSVNPVNSVPTKCIAVDSGSNLYLAGTSMIPTHNTDCLIAGALRYIGFKNYKSIIFRRTFPQLQEIIDRCFAQYPGLGGQYKSTEHRWYFPSGATIQLGHMQHENDKYNWQGKEFQNCNFDELTQFSESQYLYLFSRCRTTDPNIPTTFMSTTNPGGVGHYWVKQRFVSNCPPGQTYIDPETGLSRVFIPGTLADNPSLLENDPGYVIRLEALPEIEKMRLLHGIWDAFEGQVFTELSARVHSIKPFDPPPEWYKFMVFDWGYSSPFSCGWYAVDFDGVLYRYREWYGTKGKRKIYGEKEGGYNAGLKMSNEEIATGILDREKNEKISARIADPAIWSKRPLKGGGHGPPIVEDFANAGIFFIKADNDRVHGKSQVHKRFKVEEELDPETGEIVNEHAMFYACEDQEHFWRCMPEMREDENNPEDVDDSGEDHCLHGDTLVFTDRGHVPIRQLVGTEGKVLTVDGKWTRYRDCRKTRKNADLVTLIFSDGRHITCTPEHKILTIDGIWLESRDFMDEFGYDSIPISSKEVSCKPNLLAGKSKSLMASVIIYADTIFSGRVSGCIGLFGNTIMELSRKVHSFITRTIIDPIIRLIIWNSRIGGITNLIMPNRITMMLGLNPCTAGPRNGMEVMQEENGIASISRNTSELYLTERWKRIVRNVAINIWQAIQREINQNSAQGNVRPVRCVSVDPAERDDVYCLVAEDTHSFAVEDGLIVHNCYDELRYACMFRSIAPKKIHRIPEGSFAAERSRLIRAKKYAARHGVSLERAYTRIR